MALNVGLIRESFNAIKPHAAEFVSHFYQVLFQHHPEARSLFPEKMARQEKALIASLSHIVEYLEDGDHLKDYLRKMGARHLRYRTEDEHFAWVGEALLETFAYFFEAQWTDEHKSNWTEAYGFLASQMKEGMAEARQVVALKHKAEPPTMNEIARKVAKELFQKSLEEELASPAVAEVIRQKAKELLRRAIEDEAKQMITEIKDRNTAKSA